MFTSNNNFSHSKLSLFGEAKNTLALALPIILGEIAQIALHFIDIAMIGAIDHVQMAAASLAFNVINIPFMLGIGVTMSISQMVSLAHGKNQQTKIANYLCNGLFISLICGLIIAGGLWLFTPRLAHLGQDPEIVVFAKPFFKLIVISLIPMMVFMALKQFADGLGHTKTSMYLSILMLPFNAFMNWIFIYGKFGFPKMDLLGAGYGTIISRSLFTIILALVILLNKKLNIYIFNHKKQWLLNIKTIGQLLKIGIPIGLQITLEMSAFAVSAIIAGTFGSISLAAHQIAILCVTVTFMISTGLSQASAIKVSYAQGAKLYFKYKDIGKSTLYMSLLYGVICGIFFMIFKNELPLVFSKEQPVIKLAGSLLFYAAIFQLSDATQAVGAGLLRGIKDVKVPTILIGISYWIIGIPIGLLCAYKFQLQIYGIWIGFIIGLTFVTLFLNIRFWRKASKSNI